MVRFGVVLPTYPAGVTVEEVLAVTEAAEDLGFDSIWTTDHVILPVDQAGPYAAILEPLMTLAYVAARTNRIKLGVSILVVPQRNGIVVAKELATLDRLSGGRLVVGVGAGWHEAEFTILGAADRFHDRGAVLDETLELWRHLWTSPDTPFRGHYYDLPEVAFGPAPLQPGGPPIWIGGNSTAAQRRAGRTGLAWHPVGITAQELAAGAEEVCRAAGAFGRPGPELTPRLPMHLGGIEVEQLTAGNLLMLRGEPPAMRVALKAYESAGADQIICLFAAGAGSTVLDQMDLFAREVMPAFQGQ